MVQSETQMAMIGNNFIQHYKAKLTNGVIWGTTELVASLSYLIDLKSG